MKMTWKRLPLKAFLSNARAATPEILAFVFIGLIAYGSALIWGEGAGFMAGGILGILALLEWSR
ncbi:MAG TPA: hypothetical protein VFU48_09620 [Nitrospira sp.]|nr:hypothetical protein [Nitrospira sp.]